MNLQKIGIYFLALVMIGVLAIGCNGAPAGDVYEGTAEGYGGPVTVEVTVDEGDIVDIEVVSHDETDGFGDVAFEELIPEIIDNQGTDGVDIHSGATESSEALLEAVDEAMAQAE